MNKDHLQVLTLGKVFCFHPHLVPCLEKTLLSLTSLTTLSIVAYYTYSFSSDLYRGRIQVCPGINAVASAISHLPSLSTFRFRLAECHVYVNDFASFFVALSTSRHLTKLDIERYRFPKEENWLELLANALAQHKSLTYLNLGSYQYVPNCFPNGEATPVLGQSKRGSMLSAA
jgi:hypothetical protein